MRRLISITRTAKALAFRLKEFGGRFMGVGAGARPRAGEKAGQEASGGCDILSRDVLVEGQDGVTEGGGGFLEQLHKEDSVLADTIRVVMPGLEREVGQKLKKLVTAFNKQENRDALLPSLNKLVFIVSHDGPDSLDDMEDFINAMGHEGGESKLEEAKALVNERVQALIVKIQCSSFNKLSTRRVPVYAGAYGEKLEAVTLVEMLIGPTGAINTFLIDNLIEFVEGRRPYGMDTISMNDQELSNLLEQLKDPSFYEILNSAALPTEKNEMGRDIVRYTLNLDPGEAITPKHVKVALFSALFSPMRQSGSGSCFSTALGIYLKTQNPILALHDMKCIIEKGYFERKWKGEVVKFIPTLEIADQSLKSSWNDLFLFELRQPQGLARYEEEYGNELFMKTHPLGRALSNMGVRDGKECAKLIYDFVISRSTPIREKRAMGLLKKTRYSWTGETLTAKAFLKYAARVRSGVSQDDLKNRKHMSKLALEIRELHATGNMKEASSKIDEYDRIRRELISKEPQLKAYDLAYSSAKITFGAHKYNQLQRAWEYALASGGAYMSQTSASGKLVARKKILFAVLNKSTVLSDKRTFSGINAFILDAARDSGVNYDFLTHEDKFIRAIGTQYAERVGVRYEDGYFQFYDKLGDSNFDDEVQINTLDKLTRFVQGVIMEASLKFRSSVKPSDMAAYDEFMEKLDDHISNPGFREYLFRYTAEGPGGEMYTNGEALPESEKERKAAFKSGMDGGSSSTIYDLYFATEGEHFAYQAMQVGPADAPTNVGNPKELAISIINNVRKLRDAGVPVGDPSFRMPMTSPHHAFLLIPGMSTLKEAVNSGQSAEEWVDENLVKGDKTLIFADSNWVGSDGKRKLFALKRSATGDEVVMVTVQESDDRSIGGVDALGRSVDEMGKRWFAGRYSLATWSHEDSERLKRALGI